MEASPSPLIKLMIDTSNAAAKMLLRDFHSSHISVSFKSPGNIVTNADIAVEKLLINSLRDYDNTYSFLVEEGGLIQASQNNSSEEYYRWIIDPIDGTSNFARGHRNYCISIALAKYKKNSPPEIIAAVVNSPEFHEIYWAEQNVGAYKITSNNTQNKLHISNISSIERSMIHTGFLFHHKKEYRKLCLYLRKNHAKLRISGSAALDLTYLAAGKLDVVMHAGLHIWDIAAGTLLVQEAGGKITDLYHEEDHPLQTLRFIAANNTLHLLIANSVKAVFDNAI